MKNWIANIVEDTLDKVGCHSLADRWFKYISIKRWYTLPSCV